ncbi:MAG: response regulator [Bacteroidetes bacterium]|nr:MAG: response regulator [Bacteroidota bacterium]
MRSMTILRTRAAHYVRFFLPLLLLTGISSVGITDLAAQPNSGGVPVDSVWALLEKQLERSPTDSVNRLAVPLVRQYCGDDLACQYATYEYLMARLEQKFRIVAAVSICREMEKVVLLQGDSAKLGDVYIDYSRYYHALGLLRQMTIYVKKAQDIYMRHGTYYDVVHAKMAELERSLSYRGEVEVFADMDSLLADANRRADSAAIYYLHGRMMTYKLSAGRYKEAEQHIAAIEQKHPDPSKSGMATLAARSRAQLALIRNNPDEAEAYYQKALRFLTIRPDPWLEVSVLLGLTELEWNRDNRAKAKAYLNRAETRATAAPVDDLLPDVYAWCAQIAETEGRLADALEYTRKHYTKKEEYEHRSAGFDQKNYYLEQEKAQLTTEKKNQELELRLHKVQLRTSLIMATFVLGLAAFLLFAYFKQRAAKEKLTDQNALIHQQAEQLKSLDVAKGHFYANISHELRTPLTLMLGPIHTLLKENRLTDKQSRLLRMASRSGGKLGELINEILDLRKLESGALTVQAEPTALAGFFRNYVAQFESLAERRGIDLRFETSLRQEVAAAIDREKCRQILYNLLSNAFKFTPREGAITVELLLDEQDQLRLSVADTGSGIPPEDLEQVFDRYFQTSRPEKPAEGGTGIGLNLCREYARLFGGGITVESTPGQGSTFRVAFPVEQVELPPDAHKQDADAEESLVPHLTLAIPDVPPQASSGKTLKPVVLVVEDNPDLQDYIRMVLSEQYAVVTAENGQAALHLMMNDELVMMNNSGNTEGAGIHHSFPKQVRDRLFIIPDLILSDLMMPVMDGYQLLERLKSNDATRQIPVVMLTARAEARDRLKALRIGVDDYMTKPFDEEELLVRIQNLLKNKGARQQAAAADPDADTSALASMPQQDREWLEGFEAYIQQHFSDDILSVSLLAHTFAMSESTLLRQLKRLTGLTPAQYLQEIRLDIARQLLENRVYDSVTRVASEVGYRDARSFSRSFRERFGKLPSEVLEA